MINYEKYFGTEKRAARSLKDFVERDIIKNGPYASYSDWINKNYDKLEDGMPLLLMWLQDECDA